LKGGLGKLRNDGKEEIFTIRKLDEYYITGLTFGANFMAVKTEDNKIFCVFS